MKVRCIDSEGLGYLVTLGDVYEAEKLTDTARLRIYLPSRVGTITLYARRFEPVSDTIPALSPEPAKVDPYEAHRERLARIQGIHECDMRVLTTAEQPGATARLHAALAAEKPIERVKPFPKAARNPR